MAGPKLDRGSRPRLGFAWRCRVSGADFRRRAHLRGPDALRRIVRKRGRRARGGSGRAGVGRASPRVLSEHRGGVRLRLRRGPRRVAGKRRRERQRGAGGFLHRRAACRQLHGRQRSRSPSNRRALGRKRHRPRRRGSWCLAWLPAQVRRARARGGCSANDCSGRQRACVSRPRLSALWPKSEREKRKTSAKSEP